MGSRMTKAAYEQMVTENVNWLLQQPRTLERDHIIMIVEASVAHEYPSPRTCGCQTVTCDECLAEQSAYRRRNDP